MFKISGVVLASFLLFASSAFAAEQDPMQTVRALTEAGKVDEAYQDLLSIASSHQEDPLFYYDLGSLAFRMGRLGPAVAYLEKADHLKRHDPDIQHNLEVVRANLAQTLGPERIDPASTWSESLADHVSLEEIRGVLGLLVLILSIFWIRGYLKTHKIRVALLGPSAVIGGFCLLGVTGLYGIERFAHDRPPAIVLAKSAVRSGPGENYAELTQIDSGEKLRVLDLADRPTDWLQVRYSQEGIGWIKASDVLVVN
jgi:tetratricopeptide (TPR) repeat protein